MDEQTQQDRDDAILWARKMVAENALVLDTETTGWPKDGGECCQIAVIDLSGTEHISTLVKPQGPIGAAAAQVHGLTDAVCADAPLFTDIYPQLADLLINKTVIIYYRQFDVGILANNCRQSNLTMLQGQYTCAMLAYGAFEGSPGKYLRRGEYKWHKLTEACLQQGLEVREDAHDAAADCHMTAALVKHMATCQLSSEIAQQSMVVA